MTLTQVTKLAWYSIGLMIVTSIHHIYGAIIYNTPWRLHVLILSIPVIALTGLLKWGLTKSGLKYKRLLFWAFILITLIPSISLIGIYEGLYNHAVKNIMYFSGANTSTLEIMFPPPKYEMPNDLIFEITGVSQGVIAISMTIQSSKMFLQALRDRKF